MLDLFPNDHRTWKIFISYPSDTQDYNTIISRLSSASDAFDWEDVTDTSDNFAEAIDDSDVLIVLSGLWPENKDLINEHIKYAQVFKKPIIIIRPYGAEEIPEELNDVASGVVGWNTACIVDKILAEVDEDNEFF